MYKMASREELEDYAFMTLLGEAISNFKSKLEKLRTEYKDDEEKFLIESFKQLKNYVKGFSNLIDVANEMFRSGKVTGYLSAIYDALDEAYLLKLALAGNDVWVKYMRDRLYETAVSKKINISKEDVEKIIKKPFKNVDEAIAKIDEAIKKYESE